MSSHATIPNDVADDVERAVHALRQSGKGAVFTLWREASRLGRIARAHQLPNVVIDEIATALVDAAVEKGVNADEAIHAVQVELYDLIDERDAMDERRLHLQRHIRRRKKISQQALLYRIIDEANPRFLKSAGEKYAMIGSRLLPVNERGSGFRLWLVYQYFKRHGESPTSGALSGVMTAILAHIQEQGETVVLHRRIARTKDAIYHQISESEVVVITPNGWHIRPKDECPVIFSPTEPFHPIPRPVSDPNIRLHDLGRWMNVADPGDLDLIIAWLIGVFSPGPYPHLLISGPAGSAKSTAMAMLQHMIDPGLGSGLNLPDNPFEIGLAALRSAVLCYDNISSIPDKISDALCRVSGGASVTARKLYTDADLLEIQTRSAVVMTTIDESIITRGDLLSRTIVVQFAPITPRARRTLAEVTEEFNRYLPGLMAALYDAISHALRGAKLRPPAMGRMSDFQRWVESAAPAVGWNDGQISALYLSQDQRNAGIILDNSALAQSILRLMTATERWEGTAAALLERLRETLDHEEPVGAFPKTANLMTSQLRRLIPELAHRGVLVSLRRTKQGCMVTITSEPQPPCSDAVSEATRDSAPGADALASPPSSPPQPPHDRSDRHSPVGRGKPRGEPKMTPNFPSEKRGAPKSDGARSHPHLFTQ